MLYNDRLQGTIYDPVQFGPIVRSVLFLPNWLDCGVLCHHQQHTYCRDIAQKNITYSHCLQIKLDFNIFAVQ